MPWSDGEMVYVRYGTPEFSVQEAGQVVIESSFAAWEY
jgi:hypothetical protein